MTYTPEFWLWSGIVAAGTGILLNNEMDDFAAKTGGTERLWADRRRRQRGRPRQAPAQFHDADPRLRGMASCCWSPAAPAAAASSPPCCNPAQRHRPRHEHRRKPRSPARASPVAAGRTAGRGRTQPGYRALAGSMGTQGRSRIRWATLKASSRAGRAVRLSRHPLGRRIGGGILSRSERISTSPSGNPRPRHAVQLGQPASLIGGLFSPPGNRRFSCWPSARARTARRNPRDLAFGNTLERRLPTHQTPAALRLQHRQRLKAKGPRPRQDIIDFGMGNPDQPTPKHIVAKLVEAAQRPDTHRYSVSRGIRACAGPSATGTRPLRRRTRLRQRGHRHHRLQGRAGPLGPGDHESGRRRAGAQPSLSDSPLRLRGHRRRRHPPCTLIPAWISSELEKAIKDSWPRPRMLVLNFPANPTTQCVELDFFEKVVAIAREHKIWVIHDLAYAD